MGWYKTEDVKPTDKQPIRVIIDGREHCAYWDNEKESYAVGALIGLHDYIPISFDCEFNMERPTHWKPLLPWDLE